MCAEVQCWLQDTLHLVACLGIDGVLEIAACCVNQCISLWPAGRAESAGE